MYICPHTPRPTNNAQISAKLKPCKYKGEKRVLGKKKHRLEGNEEALKDNPRPRQTKAVRNFFFFFLVPE
jgi:hypothetical protein